MSRTRREAFEAEMLYDIPPRDTQREALAAIVAKHGVDSIDPMPVWEAPDCLRCHIRGVALHPDLGLCEPCAKHEGVW